MVLLTFVSDGVGLGHENPYGPSRAPSLPDGALIGVNVELPGHLVHRLALL